MADEESVTRRAPLSPAAAGGRFAVIGGVLLASALAFAYVGRWLTPDRLTPGRIVAALSDRGGNPIGHRRNHSKGMCFTACSPRTGWVRPIRPHLCSPRAAIRGHAIERAG